MRNRHTLRRAGVVLLAAGILAFAVGRGFAPPPNPAGANAEPVAAEGWSAHEMTNGATARVVLSGWLDDGREMANAAGGTVLVGQLNGTSASSAAAQGWMSY